MPAPAPPVGGRHRCGQTLCAWQQRRYASANAAMMLTVWVCTDAVAHATMTTKSPKLLRHAPSRSPHPPTATAAAIITARTTTASVFHVAATTDTSTRATTTTTAAGCGGVTRCLVNPSCSRCLSAINGSADFVHTPAEEAALSYANNRAYTTGFFQTLQSTPSCSTNATQPGTLHAALQELSHAASSSIGSCGAVHGMFGDNRLVWSTRALQTTAATAASLRYLPLAPTAMAPRQMRFAHPSAPTLTMHCCTTW
jgi:hypothetical protein